MKVEDVVKVLTTEVKGTPHVVHFRIATVGGVCPELTHPFSIDERASIELEGEADSVLFHNGGVGDWKEMLFQAVCARNVKMPKHPWSDSRGVAFACGVWGPHILSLVSAGSRFMVLDGKAPATERMLTWGTWCPKDDFMFSNQGGVSACTIPTPTTYANDRRSASFDHPRPRVGSTLLGPQGSEDDLGDPRQQVSRTSRQRYKPVAGFQPWSLLKLSGLSLKASNEDLPNPPLEGAKVV